MACRDAPPFQIPFLESSTRFGPFVPSIQKWLPGAAYVAEHSSYQLPSTYVRTQQVSLHGSRFQASQNSGRPRTIFHKTYIIRIWTLWI